MKQQENAWRLEKEAFESKLTAAEEVLKMREDAWKTKVGSDGESMFLLTATP